tara:strand:+ start:221867 stop:222712 length:846 start_codon:yes stop_codon:yes gene_type:complete
MTSINTASGLILNWAQTETKADLPSYSADIPVLGMKARVFYVSGKGDCSWQATIGTEHIGSFADAEAAKERVVSFCCEDTVALLKQSLDILNQMKAHGLTFGSVDEPTVDSVPYTTLVGGWRCCDFCGATQDALSDQCIVHHDGCCVPKGQEAIDAELKVINHLSNPTDEADYYRDCLDQMVSTLSEATGVDPEHYDRDTSESECYAACYTDAARALSKHQIRFNTETGEFTQKRGDIDELKEALAFYDKVQSGSSADAVPVGTDHYDWLVTAAKKVVANS